MSSKLEVIALVSGGKDSFFSILHCIANGHAVIALANLYPAPRAPSKATSEEDPTGDSIGNREAEDDLNSYMYQTVGHNVIPLYAEALDLPLYRQEILGIAINADKSYAPSSDGDGDETESLIPLFRKVMTAHPTANALSTGAILSDYQRTRVESVALRLGLVPLSFLWQYPYLPPALQTSLLDDMAAVGQDSRLIQVASGGLDERFLWGNVANEGVKRKLLKAMGRFGGCEGGAVLGEGGEYETLTVDGPVPIWKKKIVIEEGDMEVVVGRGGTALLRVRSARLDEKSGSSLDLGSIADLRIPDLLDKDFDRLQSTLEEKAWVTEERLAEDQRPLSSPPTDCLACVQSRSTTAWKISNLTAPEAGNSAEAQMQAIAAKLTACLKAVRTNEPRCSTNDIVFTTILLHSMQDFTAVNNVYTTLFIRPNPPARVTVACGDALPRNILVMVSFVIDLGPRSPRQSLHVQSRSYWAPANIGPYSQAIAVPLNVGTASGSSLVYIAGQIPLVPASMRLIQRSESDLHVDGLTTFRKQAVLSLQHLWRIGKVMEVNWWTGCIAFIAGKHNIQSKAVLGWRAWEAMHKPPTPTPESDQEDTAGGLDAWDRKYGGFGNLSLSSEIEVRYRLPDFENLIVDERPLASYPIPSFFAVQVDELPRGSEIEWQSLGVAQGQAHVTERANERIATKTCSFGNDGSATFYLSIFDTCTLEEVQAMLLEIMEREGTQGLGSGNTLHVTIYTVDTAAYRHFEAQIVPCRSVWGSAGRGLAAGVVVRRDGGPSAHEPEQTNT
ncbi:MAG: hypothetical protein M1830_004408 [Pleopsidium flavum]|nr:MAG: hypothetical protein M1830_004408 [Pleopsidium flavum]